MFSGVNVPQRYPAAVKLAKAKHIRRKAKHEGSQILGTERFSLMGKNRSESTNHPVSCLVCVCFPVLPS